ncbi:MAG TPA: hypothetical protein VGJ26_15725, partial [Pirellulales bacterium]
MPTLPRRRWYQFTAWLLVISALVAGAGWLWWASHRGWSVGRLERLVQAETPPGSDRATVEACLNRHHISYSWFNGARRDMWGSETALELAGLQGVEISGTLYVHMRGEEANVGILDSGSVSLYFF